MEALKVLVVDDEKLLADSIAELLKKETREVKIAYSLSEAKEMIKNDEADLIISDICFPGEEEGFVLTKYVEEDSKKKEFIFISGYGNTELEKRARIEGGLRFFHKPLDFNLLEKLVENIENRLIEGKVDGLNLPQKELTIKDEDARTFQKAYLTGDERAFEKLISNYKNLVFSIGKNWYGLKNEDLEDLYQDLCVEVLLKISRIRNIRTFIIGTTMNMARKIIAKNKKNLKEQESLNNNILEFNPEKQIIKKELQNKLMKAINKLDPKMKKIIWALFIEDMSYKEISEKFNIPIGSIGPTRVQIIKKLRQLLKNY